MTVTEPCVSLTTGTLSPDLRVNYAFGMVLGLDEFLQEQLHRITHLSLHDRSEHGYGTVSGLAVSVAPVAGADDFQVMVTTGIALDQWGRQIVIRCDQCARLGAWLAEQELREPGIVNGQLGPSGELTVYVVASYAECLDAMVPLPGEPCSSSAQTMVPSRIRDAWDVELRWEPPAMPRWDSDRRLARLLNGVEIVAGLPPADSDEAAITDAVVALAALADNGPSDLSVDDSMPSGTVAWRLPADSAAEALDRIFTTWVTLVRPALHPDLIEPEVISDPAVLISAITFVPASPFLPATPAITACDDPDDEGRPFLLHTQLIQELRWLNDALAVAPAVDPVQLVTLAADGSGTHVRLTAWFHLTDAVQLPDFVEVTDERGTTVKYATSAVDDSGNAIDFSDVWTLLAEETDHTRDFAQLAARFPEAKVFVGNVGTTLGDVQLAGLTLLDAEPGGDVLAYAEVRVPPADVVVPPVPKQRASQEFVTVTGTVASEKEIRLEFWFHPEHRGPKDDAFIVRPVFQVFDESDGSELSASLSGPSPWSRNVWRVVLETNVTEDPRFLRLVFWTKECGVETESGDGMSLSEWIDKREILFVGWTRDDAAILAFTRVGPSREFERDNPLGPFERRLNGMIGDPRRVVTPAVLRRRIAADRDFFERIR